MNKNRQIWKEREKQTKIETHTHTHTNRKREREREREREKVPKGLLLLTYKAANSWHRRQLTDQALKVLFTSTPIRLVQLYVFLI